MAHSLKQQPEKVTQEMFDRLPALLTAHTTKLVTGFDDHELRDAVDGGQIEAYKRPVRAGRKRAYSKYTKVSVGKLCGFRV